MTRARAVAAAIALTLFLTAFIAASRSCEGGLELYFGAGVVAVVLMAAVPFALRAGRPMSACVAAAVGYAAAGAGVWIAGLFIANVRIMCRLF